MKTIIAGSRHITDPTPVRKAIEASKFEITEVVSGMAAGVDTIGVRLATQSDIPVAKFPPDWRKFGKRAGPIRNQQMADYADALIAVWDGRSRGTRDMIGKARRGGLRVFVFCI